MTDEGLWRKRFLLVSLVRLSGTAIALLGMAIAFGNFVKPGGSPLLGIGLIVVGLVDLALVPRLLSRRWRER